MLEHEVKESTGKRHTVSKVLRFVAVDANMCLSDVGYAPHLDLRSPTGEEFSKIKQSVLTEAWLDEDLEKRVLSFAAGKIVSEHYHEIKTRRENHVDKISQEVRKRFDERDKFLDRSL